MMKGYSYDVDVIFIHRVSDKMGPLLFL